MPSALWVVVWGLVDGESAEACQEGPEDNEKFDYLSCTLF